MTNLPRHHCDLSSVMAVMREKIGHENYRV
jgi:hypothetical protein